MEAIKRDFGSLEAMQEKLSASTVAVQGSGWGWLGFNKAAGKLAIATCANQVLLMPGFFFEVVKEITNSFTSLLKVESLF